MPLNADLAIAEKTSHLAPLTRTQQRLLDAMVWDGRKLYDAAKEIGISDRQARNLIRDPAMVKAIRDETQVLRTSARPRALARAVEIGDQDDNLNAAVSALKLVIDDPQARSGNVQVNVNVTPGYVLDVREADRGPIIDADEVIRIDGTEPEAS